MRAPAFAAALLFSAPAAASGTFDHGVWNALLRRHVVLLDGGKASRVNYAGFAAERGLLREYLAALSQVDETKFKVWSKSEQLAFLINAYNAFTIELVLTRYPDLQSIKDIGSLFRTPWQRRFFTLLGRERTLDDIEHGMIRAPDAYRDPRIHFAVVCASIGCPALRNEAYTGERIEEQLEDNVRKFLSDRSRNRYEHDSRTLALSKLFDWYAEDFSRGWGGYRSVPQFIARYAELLTETAEERRAVASDDVRVRFLPYDWSLNDASR